MWLPSPSRAVDLHAGFRGRLTLDRAERVEFRVLGASWYLVEVDGELLSEGPPRFPVAHPEYSAVAVDLDAGEHLLTAHVHHLGVATRMLDNLPGFLYAEAAVEGSGIPITWRCAELAGYIHTGRRSSPLYGWQEWCDTAADGDWRSRHFDDAAWVAPATVDLGIGELSPLGSSEVQHIQHRLAATASGTYREAMPFYELDDPPMRFFGADLEVAASAAPDGAWRRYDLGRVRLGTPRLVIDAPAGSWVEFGSAEFLTHGQVAPVFPGSTGLTSTVDHFKARGGPQEFRPLHPKGMRFLEVHVRANPDDVRFVEENFLERTYFGEPEGTFQSGDALLDRIWAVSVETLRACSEDAVIDTPNRERGQWLGDVATVGMEIAAVAYSDLGLFERGLRMAADCASAEGIVAGLCPAEPLAMSTYALQWTTACLRYWELTGDRRLLDDLYAAATKNMLTFGASAGDLGLDIARLPWTFVDWGYVPRPSGADMALNIHAVLAAQDMARWARLLGRESDASTFATLAAAIEAPVRRWFDATLAEGGWPAIGYHCAVLALRAGMVPEDLQSAAVAALKTHILGCYPNDQSAPRLTDPYTQETRLITPYFAHYAFPELIKRGEMDFVLDQYRACWGWMLDQGVTTLLEVFDLRWSRSHQWSGSPAWQLSRHVLGLWTDQVEGRTVHHVDVSPGSLPGASGRLPLPDGGVIEVQWKRQAEGIAYRLTADRPVLLDTGKGGPVSTNSWEGTLTASYNGGPFGVA